MEARRHDTTDDAHDRVEILDELLRIALDAERACARAVEAARGDALVRGALLTFLSEHEQHAAELASLGARDRGRPSELAIEPAFESQSAALRTLRQNAELAVRRYRAALDVVPLPLLPRVRAQANAWLRHRAWLSAQLASFPRDSQTPP